MMNFKKTLIAAAVTLVAGSANAVTFDVGSNALQYVNLENQYRTDENCRIYGGCVADSGPAGWALVDISIAGNVVAGDVFAGVFDVQRVVNASGTWFSSATDQFTGYFAQQVVSIDLTNPAVAQIIFDNVASDPFSILAAGEMFRLYTQTGAGTTIFSQFTGGTVESIIGLATDGTFWGSLGIVNDAAGDGYAYSLDNLTLPGNDTQTKTEAFLALDLIATGASYNAGILGFLNDTNEALEGGVTAARLCTAAEIADPTKSCTNFVGTSEIELNPEWTGVDGTSPWSFLSNDPAYVQVPEPGTLTLLGASLIGLAGLRRRKA